MTAAVAVTSFGGRRRMALPQVFPQPESGFAAPPLPVASA
jgi:hypothetical protein